jgi:hypothetical protein
MKWQVNEHIGGSKPDRRLGDIVPVVTFSKHNNLV